MLTLTKKERKLLENLAKQLPATQYTANIRMSGVEVVEKGIPSNFPIDPKKYYGVAVKYPTNHKNRVIKAYTSGGMEAVKKYCAEVQELATKQLTPIDVESHSLVV
jgi:hypothetical protein